MTISRFDRIPDVLIAIAYLLVGWQMIFGIEREIRIGMHASTYGHPAPGRDRPTKLHGRLFYLNATDAQREAATFPIVACGVFLGLVGRRMKRTL